MRRWEGQGHLPPEKGGSLALLCMDRAVTVQEGGFGLAQETNAHPEDVMGSGMWREGWECNDRGLATRRTGGGPAQRLVLLLSSGTLYRITSDQNGLFECPHWKGP